MKSLQGAPTAPFGEFLLDAPMTIRVAKIRFSRHCVTTPPPEVRNRAVPAQKAQPSRGYEHVAS
ncbi:hypothetical protein [Saccharopolyspora sp. NPDC002686]|uniref:hypothetical protein n=1 Tax=Saccharopolyspora sp. NPDC002686 TaxID=3154541 RepID=UPI0033212FCD